MSERPFWSDDFDMDLPKVIPGAREALGRWGDVKLVTEQTGRRDGNKGLIHPCVWNGDTSMLAFFGFRTPARPSGLVTGSNAEIVECTAWEAFRDCWTHSYRLHVVQTPVWDTFPLRPDFDDIMFDLRGWDSRKAKAERAKKKALLSIKHAVLLFAEVCARYGVGASQIDDGAEIDF